MTKVNKKKKIKYQVFKTAFFLETKSKAAGYLVYCAQLISIKILDVVYLLTNNSNPVSRHKNFAVIVPIPEKKVF